MANYYKDTVGSSIPINDLHLRPNICVAMAIAPEIFDRDNARNALKLITSELMPGLGSKQIGIRTLNDANSAYRGYYDNSNDSDDYSVAHGFSYHNGPEWVWPVGYYLLAILEFTNDTKLILKCLKPHFEYIQNSS